jgi:uncharacterized membrane protein YeaQ/YmgE (transglycosylase-associated protein family)
MPPIQVDVGPRTFAVRATTVCRQGIAAKWRITRAVRFSSGNLERLITAGIVGACITTSVATALTINDDATKMFVALIIAVWTGALAGPLVLFLLETIVNPPAGADDREPRRWWRMRRRAEPEPRRWFPIPAAAAARADEDEGAADGPRPEPGARA